MEKALQALTLSEGDPLLTVSTLHTIIGIDIMASRDDDAWEKAMAAEAIAREHGFKKELADILIAKAKLCSYAEISPETGRNDEGLSYANEALSLAQPTGHLEQQAESCYIIGSLHINKNRWLDPIDPEIYRTAGQWLDRGQALADSCDNPRLRRNGILFRSRWFQQGDRNEEAITWFEQALSALKETDYLTASALDDRLVRLYTRTGRYQDALDIHDDKDLRNPAGNIAGEITKLSSEVSMLSPDQIRERCEQMISGANSINADVADYVEDVLLKRSRQIADIGLSQREIQIIRLSAEGLTAAQIAERVFLSVNTVNTHRQRIYRKMDVKNVSEMLRKATELGIL